jgi:hypothetical protein
MISQEVVNDKVNGLEKGYSMMECPHCKADETKVYDKTKQTWEFAKWVNPCRARYICGFNADHTVQYEI